MATPFLSALRVTARIANTRIPPVHHRPIIHSLLRTPPSCLRPTVSLQSRPLSLSTGSIWVRHKFRRTPSVSTVWAISRLEASANADPHDPSKQLALFQALSQSETNEGYDLVIARWERMCEFDPSSPLLRSDLAFQLYITALIKRGLSKSTDSAVRRRESLLAARPLPTTEHATSNTESASTSPPPASLRSHDIAQGVISGNPLASHHPTGDPSLSGGTSLGGGTSINYGAGGQGNPIHVTLHEPSGAIWIKIVRNVLLLVGSVFVILVIISVLLENSGLLKAGPKHAEFEPQQHKTVKFSDVHGVDEVKEELKDVVEFLKDPTIFATLGGKLPKGVLLTGPPGTGKTMLARAVAGEAGVPFLFASGSEFEEMFVGVGAKRVRELFAAARKKQPAIIFIDELDAVGGKRSSRDQQYMKQTLNQLLVEMDGFLQSEGVIVIAATNFPESLDPALTRPGRFDKVIAVPLPDIRGRVQILKHHMRDVIASLEADPTILARGTAGFSGADLENLVNQAAIQASKQGFSEVMLSHFEWAKDRIIMGSERKSAYIDEKSKLMTAYHEGGHALALLYTDGAIPLHKVTCVPRGHSLGMTTYLPEADRVSTSLKEYQAQIDVCMGGRVAEALIYGADNVTSGASSDLQQATRTATAMVKNFGFSQKIGPVYYSEHEETISPQTKEQIDAEVRRLLQAGEQRVLALLKSKENELHLLARALVEHETLNADEVRKVIKGEPIGNIKDIIKEDLTVLSTEPTNTPSPES